MVSLAGTLFTTGNLSAQNPLVEKPVIRTDIAPTASVSIVSPVGAWSLSTLDSVNSKYQTESMILPVATINSNEIGLVSMSNSADTLQNVAQREYGTNLATLMDTTANWTIAGAKDNPVRTDAAINASLNHLFNNSATFGGEIQPTPVYIDQPLEPQGNAGGFRAFLRNKGIRSTVTFYGSARILSPEKAQVLYDQTLARVGLNPKTPAEIEELATAEMNLKMSAFYSTAEGIGRLVVRKTERKTAHMSGGGPSMMEAPLKGARKEGGVTVGLNIILPHEQRANPYADFVQNHDEFAQRMKNLRSTDAAIFMPGGNGTFAELFDLLTLIQTGKMSRIPIVLIGRDWWHSVLNVDAMVKTGVISKSDKNLIEYADTPEEAYDLIKDHL